MINFSGQVEAIIDEMKRRAQVSTDTELASLIGTTQSNVSTWRKRGSVPKSTLLKFDQILAEQEHESSLGIASRMVAYRLAEYWMAGLNGKAVNEKRWVVMATLASGHFALIRAIKRNIEKEHLLSGLSHMDIASGYIKNEEFLDELRRWFKDLSFSDMIAQSI